MKLIEVTPVEDGRDAPRKMALDMDRSEGLERDGDTTLILLRYRDPLRVRETPSQIQALLDEA